MLLLTHKHQHTSNSEGGSLLTRAGINVSEQLKVGTQPVEISWISSPLESNGEFLNTLGKRCWGLQLLKKQQKTNPSF